MKVGVPTEIMNNENRVDLIPAGVKDLVYIGYQVFIQKGAGEGSNITDNQYKLMGATILDNAQDVYQEAELLVKVKEPLESEYNLLKPGQILFTFLHLAAALKLTKVLQERKIIGVSYETVQLENGTLPLLTPMSMVAGRMSVQEGAIQLKNQHGGLGILLGGVPGVEKGG